MAETCKYRIGVDVEDDYNKVFSVSVYKGIKPVFNARYVVEDSENIYEYLETLVKKYNTLINFERNRKILYCLFAEKNSLCYLLEEFNPDPIFRRKQNKGFNHCRAYQELWDKFKYLIEVKPGFDNSARIALLPLLNKEQVLQTMLDLEFAKFEVEKLTQKLNHYGKNL